MERELFYLKKFFKVDTCFEYTGLMNKKKAVIKRKQNFKSKLKVSMRGYIFWIYGYFGYAALAGRFFTTEQEIPETPV